MARMASGSWPRLALLLGLAAAVTVVAAVPATAVETSARGTTFMDMVQSVIAYFKSGIEALLGREGAVNVLVGNSRVKYTNYQLLRVKPRTEAQLKAVMEMGDEIDGDVKFWTQPRKNWPMDILVAPDSADEVRVFLKKRGIKYDVLVRDLQEDNEPRKIVDNEGAENVLGEEATKQEHKEPTEQMIAMQNPKMSKDQRDMLRSQVGHSMTFKRYHRYSDMLKYMEHLSTTYPDLVQVMNIGRSSQGLPLKVVKVSTGHVNNSEPQQKPAFWIDGGTHAREWISPATALYILKQLVENYKVNKKIVEGIDWYVMPVVNPDGYEYSHTTDRLWRKTRSKAASEDDEDEDEEDDVEDGGVAEASGRTSRRRRRRGGRVFWERCEGVDINRNWDFHWGGRGASDDPCDETYSGSKAFSEPETRAIADFLMNNRDKFKVFVSLHSYAQMWLLPWGFTKTAPDDHDDLMRMGRTAVDAIAKVSGAKYDLGGSTALLYHSSGGADDWAKGVAGIKYSYTVELRDTGNYGFLLPASQIIPTGKEIFAGVKAMAKSLLETPS